MLQKCKRAINSSVKENSELQDAGDILLNVTLPDKMKLTAA